MHGGWIQTRIKNIAQYHTTLFGGLCLVEQDFFDVAFFIDTTVIAQSYQPASGRTFRTEMVLSFVSRKCVILQNDRIILENDVPEVDCTGEFVVLFILFFFFLTSFQLKWQVKNFSNQNQFGFIGLLVWRILLKETYNLLI